MMPKGPMSDKDKEQQDFEEELWRDRIRQGDK